MYFVENKIMAIFRLPSICSSDLSFDQLDERNSDIAVWSPSIASRSVEDDDVIQSTRRRRRDCPPPQMHRHII